jgi:hypothetical protein
MQFSGIVVFYRTADNFFSFFGMQFLKIVIMRFNSLKNTCKENIWKYSRDSLIRTNWDSGMFGFVNFRINRVFTKYGGGGGGV